MREREREREIVRGRERERERGREIVRERERERERDWAYNARSNTQPQFLKIISFIQKIHFHIILAGG